MSTSLRKLFTTLSPIFGAGAVGACPLCWIGSASLLTYLGLGALIPAWQGIVVALFSLSVVGFVFDYSSHKNLNPLILLVVGGALLYLGRYVFGGAGVLKAGKYGDLEQSLYL